MEPDKITKVRKVTRKWSIEEKSAHCQSWRQSGLSRSAFCQREGLSLPTLCSWLKRQAPAKKLPPGLKFMPASLNESFLKEEPILEVRLTNGMQCRFLHIINVKQICEIIEGLQHVTTD